MMRSKVPKYKLCTKSSNDIRSHHVASIYRESSFGVLCSHSMHFIVSYISVFSRPQIAQKDMRTDTASLKFST